MTDIEFDTSDFDKKIKGFILSFPKTQKKGSIAVAVEILRLSETEVPFRDGWLKQSATYQDEGDDVIVGYNKVYAARLHEHPEYRFGNGKKGKYLEDPIKHNLSFFLQVMGEAMRF